MLTESDFKVYECKVKVSQKKRKVWQQQQLQVIQSPALSTTAQQFSVVLAPLFGEAANTES